MKRYFRHIVGPVAFVLIIGAAAFFVTSARFGKLTIDIIETISGFDIEYGDIKGNVLQGFRVDDYRVKMSDTDSICGARAEIHYRFNLFMLQLPNLFEVNLVDPKITIHAKRSIGERRALGLPNIRLRIRMNLKNGQVTYQNETEHEADRISGLVFADFVGSQIRLVARNLSFRSERRGLNVSSVDLDAEIENEMVRLRSLKVNADGLVLKGSGLYVFEPESAYFDFREARVQLKNFDLPDANIDFTGNITYASGRFMPRLRGTVRGVDPVRNLAFETDAYQDTIRVDVTDAQAFGGSFEAMVKIVRSRVVEAAANFSDFDVAPLIGMDSTLVCGGHVAYAHDAFHGVIISPAEKGLGVDSVVCHGSFVDSTLFLDSLFVIDGARTLSAHGPVLPDVDLHLVFSGFDFTRFRKYFDLSGSVSGSARLAGKPGEFLKMSLGSNLTFHNIAFQDFSADTVAVRAREFRQYGTVRDLTVNIEGIRLGSRSIEHSRLSISDTVFTLSVFDGVDTVLIDGTLHDALRGSILSLLINYNRTVARVLDPIEFDIMSGKVGDMRVSIADGTAYLSLDPLGFRLEGIDMRALGKLFGLRVPAAGTLDASLVRDTLIVRGRGITFMGLANGTLALAGRYADRGVIVDSLHIEDDNGQVLDAAGFVSREQSNVSAEFRDVGIWVLAFLEKFLGNPKGLMTGRVNFKGNLERFEFGGGGRIHDASFTVDIIASRVDSLAADVVFQGDKIIFTSGRGIISPLNGRDLTGQWIDAGGIVKLEKRMSVRNLNFDFSFVDAPIQFPPFAYGIGSGSFSLNMRDRVMHYNGAISVKEAVVPLEFGMKIQEDQRAQDDDWRLNLVIRGERGVWLRNRDADIEFGGELSIVKETGPVHLSGVLESTRGNYRWLNHILSITEGRVIFIPEDEIDPEVDFWAVLDTREGVKIILHMSGPISEPIFEFYTDPPGEYTEQDILTYLNLNITWQELEQIKRGEYMSKILPRSLLSWLEGDVSRAIKEYIGLDYFNIETPFFEENERTKLTVGKYLSRNLFVTYTYDITTFSNEFNVEYFIDDKNKIHVQRDETGEYSLQYQYRLRF